MLRIAIFLLLLGLGIYLGLRAAERGRNGVRASKSPKGSLRSRLNKPEPKAILAPDDDPEFLRKLRRDQFREKKAEEPESAGDPGDAADEQPEDPASP